jgi:hypothetical protein
VRVDDQIESFADDVASAGSRAPASPPGVHTMKEFQEILPLGKDETPYRLVTKEHVGTFEAGGRTFLEVGPEALTQLAYEAMRDIAHKLRPGHLSQLRKILEDPSASANDRFVALDLLKNANIAAGGVLPMCQDTGTAIVMGKRGQNVLTQGGDEAALSRGIAQAYETSTCATRSSRRSTCGRRRTRATTSLRRSSSTRPMATPTSFSSWPRAAARRTRATSTRRPRRS